MNRLKKYSKLIFIIFILIIISIIAPSISYAHNKGDTKVVEKATNSNLTGGSFTMTFNDLSGANGNTWYLMCNEHGAALKNVKTKYTLISTNSATTEEAYILSDLDTYNAKGYYKYTSGQNAWWNRGNNSTSSTTDTLYIQDLCMSFTSEGEGKISDLITSGDIAGEDTESVKDTLEDIITEYGSRAPTDENIDDLYDELLDLYSKTMSGISSGSALTEEAKAFAKYIGTPSTKSYNKGTTSYTIDGITVKAADLQMDIKMVTDDATVYFSEPDNSYLIGPFKLIYPEAGFTKSDGTYIMFAGLDETDLTLKTNLGEMTYGTDWKISYTSSDSADINGLPKSNKEFYIALNYKVGMTQVTKIEFTYKYMNAGGVWSNYSGAMTKCPKCGAYNDCDATQCKNGCQYAVFDHYVYADDGTTVIGYVYNYYYYTPSSVHAQNMAVLNRAVRWYTYDKFTWSDVLNRSSIKVEKTVVNDSGDKVKVDDTFYFDVYVDYGDGEKLFETLAVKTIDGYGSKTSEVISWSGDDATPTYRVVERDKDGYSIDGPWNGSFSSGRTITIEAENTKESLKGKLEIDKRFISPTEPLLEETFNFKVTITGTFSYNGGEVKTYTSSNPFILDNVSINASNDWKWISELFEWYDEDDAPKYKVEEKIPDDADYELVGTTGDKGTLIDSETQNTIAIFTNTSIQKENYLHVNKEVIGQTAPESGEVFYVKIEINGDFKYKDIEYTQGNTLSLDIELNESNNWSWDSDKITWLTTTAPTYKIVETGMPDNYTYVSTTDQSKSTTTNDFSSTLQEGHTYVTITNQKEEDKEGTIRIIKLAETDDIAGKIFKFRLTVDGDFSYNGTHYTSYTIEDTINAVTTASDATVKNNTLKEYDFTWEPTQSAPKYTVEEIEISDDAEFVSISNNTKTVTNTPSISGSLIEDDTVVIKIVNKGIDTIDSRIQIVKETIGNTEYLNTLSDDEKTFKFTVEISGTFNYTDDSGNVTTVNEDVLTIPASVIGKGTEDGSSSQNIWLSGKIEWNADVKAPSYKVTEIEIPDYAEFVSWSNRTTTVQTKTISGTVGTDITTVLTAINDIGGIDHRAMIKVLKKAQTDNISGELFNFTLTVTGNFTYNNTEYTSDNPLELNIDVIADGESWNSDPITWNDGDVAPTYTIKENLTEEQINDGVKLVSISDNTNGCLVDGTPSVITAVNKKDPHPNQGRIEIEKTYISNGNEIKGVNFKFEIEVTYANGDKVPITVTVTSGSTYRSGYFYWESNEEAPTYKITEIEVPSGVNVSIDKPTGSLVDGDIIKVKAKNTIVPKTGKLSIQKIVEVDDKISDSDVTGTFTFDVNVTGTFTYDGKTYVDETMQLQVKIDANGTWTSKDFTWYGDAPTYGIEETDLPSGYTLVGITNSSGTLKADSTIKSVCRNKLGGIEVYILTMEIGGKVWDDTDYSAAKEADKNENGLIDEGEAGLEGVKVTVTRVITDSSGNIIARLNDIYVYDENDNITRISNVTYTDSNGNWSFGAISVPGFVSDSEKDKYSGYNVSYDVTFSYDGQTYEPTTFLATSNGDASSFRNASTSNRDKWLYDSMAIDDSNARETFNAKFTNIEGQDPMDVNGNTVGKATGNGSTTTLNYSSTDSLSVFNSDNTRKISTLETYNSNGRIYDDFLIDASTSTGALTYPFDNEIHLESWDKGIDSITGLSKTKYYFSATYNYLKSINLGLIKREATDIAVEKDLTEAIVVINGKVLKYKYNSAIDLDNPDNYELLYKQIAVADEEIEYTLGLYTSDYYYRASIYDGSDAGNALGTFYGSLSLPVSSTELEIYLKYTINVYNESNTYDVRINSLADYYDETFTLITDASQSKTYVQTLNGKEVNSVINLAEAPTVTYYDSSENAKGDATSLTWSNSGTIDGSDGITYNKLSTTSLSGTKLTSGERAEITTTFKVNKDVDENSIADSIILGEKHNLAEITSFTSYYSNTSKNKWSSPGQVTGRVDEDSAPDNINIHDLNEKAYYEDDTDSAPILTIELYGEDREVNGMVWEDAQTSTVQYSQTIGNGLYNPDEGDKTISGLTTEIVETISIPTASSDSSGNTVYEEFEFIWPTATQYNWLGGKSLEELTGFDSTIETDTTGQYAFTAVPAGNYKVRFVYGDKLVETGNDGYEEIYNGQDYKSTSYQVGFNNDSDGDGYTDNEWHDLSNEELNSARVSDARDSEARRLVVASNSEILQYDNTNILATADDKDAEHDELFGNYEEAKANGSVVTGDGYYMYAETAKLNIEVENIYDINYTTETIDGIEDALLTADGDIDKGAVDAGNVFTYKVNNIDAGIEERSQTKLTLDKQIKEITLTTSDGNVILDAVYDIIYNLDNLSDDGIKTSVTLNKQLSTGYDKIASLNRNSSSQGYRYIMAEGTILQGTTITVQYQLMVFNVGEADTCNQILKDIWSEVNSEGMTKDTSSKYSGALTELTSPYYTVTNGRVKNSDYNSKYQYGTYFGSIYYLGTQGTYTTDNILVESTVHQIVDYVDPDVEFIDTDNISVDQSWSSVNIEDLIDYADNGKIDPAIIQIINTETGEPVVVNNSGDIVTNSGSEISEVTYYNYKYNKGISSSTYSALASGLTNGTYKYSIINDYLQEFITDSKNNVIINIDNGSSTDTAGTNPSLVKATVPYTANSNTDEDEAYARATASINLKVSRYYSSEEDSSDIDNIAEIIKVENTVGRRDIRTIAGNTSTYELEEGATGYDETVDLYTISGEEPDTSATEVITLSPPTGLNAGLQLVLQIIAIVLVAGIILAVGIVVIKKKVLLKK